MNVNRHLSDAFCGRWQIECRSQLPSSTSTLPLPLALPVRCSALLTLSLRFAIRVTATRHRSDSRAQERGCWRQADEEGGRETQSDDAGCCTTDWPPACLLLRRAAAVSLCGRHPRPINVPDCGGHCRRLHAPRLLACLACSTCGQLATCITYILVVHSHTHTHSARALSHVPYGCSAHK